MSRLHRRALASALVLTSTLGLGALAYADTPVVVEPAPTPIPTPTPTPRATAQPSPPVMAKPTLVPTPTPFGQTPAPTPTPAPPTFGVAGQSAASIPTGGTFDVYGSRLDQLQAVTFDGQPVPFTVVSQTKVTISTPPHATAFKIPLTFSNGVGNPLGGITVDVFDPAAVTQSEVPISCDLQEGTSSTGTVITRYDRVDPLAPGVPTALRNLRFELRLTSPNTTSRFGISGSSADTSVSVVVQGGTGNSAMHSPYSAAGTPLLRSTFNYPSDGTFDPYVVTAAAGSSEVTLSTPAFRGGVSVMRGDLSNVFDVLQWHCTLGGPFARIPVSGAPTPTPTPEVVPTPTPEVVPTPTPTVIPEPVAYSYGLKGNATLKTLTKGSVPVTGGLEARIVQPYGGGVTGVLSLDPSQGNLTTLGFLPVVAKVNLVATEPISGNYRDGALNATAKVRIKLPSVKTLGVELAGGANCQAKQISSITLASTGPFNPATGGSVAGTFAISDLTGCGFLTGLVSPLTQGSGNLIALNLTKK